MKKLLIALWLCWLIPFVAGAQLRTALVGGMHLSSVPANTSPGWDTLQYNYQGRTAFHAGLLVDFSFSPYSKFYLQSGMFYTNKGRSFETPTDSSASIVRVNGLQYTNYMEVPLNLVLKLKLGKKSKFIIGGGPYLSFLYDGKERKETHYINGSMQYWENTDLKVATQQGRYVNFDYGLNGLLGVEIGRFFVTANYSRGFSDFYQPSGTQGKEFRHEVMGGSLGFYLTNPKRKTRVRDRDKDGIPDKQDACPLVAGDSTAAGCPDADHDGVADKEDKCPSLPGTARYQGCPIPDTDGDGVNDEADSCLQTPGSPRYHGCPIPDTDGDGVNDEEDKCPAVAGSASYAGCPVPDRDQDGVPDDQDKCPDKKGTASNNGCPEISQELIKKVNQASRRIQFNYMSTTLTGKSKIVLNEVVKILKANPDLKVFIAGYTSSDGNPKNHIPLSTRRAMAVLNYLLSKGIERSRLEAKGFGASHPLNSEKTEYQRSLNRRVEMKLSNH